MNMRHAWVRPWIWWSQNCAHDLIAKLQPYSCTYICGRNSTSWIRGLLTPPNIDQHHPHANNFEIFLFHQNSIQHIENGLLWSVHIWILQSFIYNSVTFRILWIILSIYRCRQCVYTAKKTIVIIRSVEGIVCWSLSCVS